MCNTVESLHDKSCNYANPEHFNGTTRCPLLRGCKAFGPAFACWYCLQGRLLHIMPSLCIRPFSLNETVFRFFGGGGGYINTYSGIG